MPEPALRLATTPREPDWSPSAPGMLFFAAVVLLGANLRAVFSSLPPLLEDVRAELGLSAAAAGLLTTLPLLCFGLLAPTRSGADPPRLDRAVAGRVHGAHRARRRRPRDRRRRGAVRRDPRRRLGRRDRPDDRADADPRPLPPPQRQPDRRLLDGAAAGRGRRGRERRCRSSASSTTAGAAPSPCSRCLRVVAALFWLPPASRERTVVRHAQSFGFHNLARSWSLAAYFGLQSMAFYCGLTWLPTILQHEGYSEAAAGSLQALVSACPARPGAARSRRRDPPPQSEARCCSWSSRSRRPGSSASCSRREPPRSG